MELLEEIQHHFANMSDGKVHIISALGDEYKAWAIKEATQIGVLIKTRENVEFSESFANARIYTQKVSISDDDSFMALMLVCRDLNARNEFASVCYNFVNPGVNGENRNLLIDAPEIWWNKWKELIGNKSTTKSSYDIIGEMSMLEYLCKQGKNPRWSGIESATHDVELDDCCYEVKSSTMRYGYEVVIHSIYQLQSDVPLSVIYCRFEESNNGRSIEDLYLSLVSFGMDENKLDVFLTNKGFEKGCTARNKRYRMLEFKEFPVDDKFPALTEKSFKNECLPSHLVRFSYTLNLDGLANNNLNKYSGDSV